MWTHLISRSKLSGLSENEQKNREEQKKNKSPTKSRTYHDNTADTQNQLLHVGTIEWKPKKKKRNSFAQKTSIEQCARVYNFPKCETSLPERTQRMNEQHRKVFNLKTRARFHVTMQEATHSFNNRKGSRVTIPHLWADFGQHMPQLNVCLVLFCNCHWNG